MYLVIQLEPYKVLDRTLTKPIILYMGDNEDTANEVYIKGKLDNHEMLLFNEVNMTAVDRQFLY